MKPAVTSRNDNPRRKIKINTAGVFAAVDQCQMPEDFLAKGRETERTKELREREERMEKSAFKKRLDYDDYQKVMRGMKTIVPS